MTFKEAYEKDKARQAKSKKLWNDAIKHLKSVHTDKICTVIK